MKNLIVVLWLSLGIIFPVMAVSFPATVPYNPYGLKGAFRIEVFKVVGNNATSVYKWSYKGSFFHASKTLQLERRSKYYVRIMGNSSTGTKGYSIIKKFFKSGPQSSKIVTRPFLNGTFSSKNDIGYFTRRVAFLAEGRDVFSLEGSYAGQQFIFSIPYQIVD